MLPFPSIIFRFFFSVICFKGCSCSLLACFVCTQYILDANSHRMKNIHRFTSLCNYTFLDPTTRFHPPQHKHCHHSHYLSSPSSSYPSYWVEICIPRLVARSNIQQTHPVAHVAKRTQREEVLAIREDALAAHVPTPRGSHGKTKRFPFLC